jgi:hypothetical protein
VVSKQNNANNCKSIFVLLFLLFCTYLLLGITNLNKASDPQAFDTTAYLGEANIINNNGGILNFLNLCVSGKYKQANQHPLFILLLSPFASTNISFFITAKLISFFVGFLLICCTFIICKKMFGDLVAIISVMGLILNEVFLEWTTMVAAESLLMLFGLLSIYFIIEGFRKNHFWIYAGVCAGLAYLAKGTGIFLIPGFFISAVIVNKFNILKNKFFYLFFISFVIVASPLFIRNVIVYQDPFFNVNKYIAEYSWDQVYNSKYTVFNPKEGTNQWRFEKLEKQNKSDSATVTTLKNFKSTSSIDKIRTNVRSHVGAFLYSFIIYQKYFSGSIINLIEDNTLGAKFWLFSLILILFFIIGLFREKNLGARIYLVTTLIIFYIALTLFRPLTRYALPLVPIVWIYISLGVYTSIKFISDRYLERKKKINILLYLPYLLSLFLVLNIGYILAKNKLQNPLQSVEYSENRKNLLNWLRSNLKKGDTYTMGPNFNWQLDHGIWVLPPTSGKEDITKLISFVRRHNVRYIIFERNYILSWDGVINKKLIGDYFDVDKSEGLVPIKNIEDWKLVYKDEQKPVEYLVYSSK